MKRRKPGTRYVELRGALFRLNDEAYREMLVYLTQGLPPDLHRLGSWVAGSTLNITNMSASEAAQRLSLWDKENLS